MDVARAAQALAPRVAPFFLKLKEYITGQTILVDGGITTGSTRALPAKKA